MLCSAVLYLDEIQEKSVLHDDHFITADDDHRLEEDDH